MPNADDVGWVRSQWYRPCTRGLWYGLGAAALLGLVAVVVARWTGTY